MDDLIEALQIMRKYGNPSYPTCCEHDVMYVMVDPADVSEADLERLETLGFTPDDDLGNVFSSFKFGSA